MGDMIIRVKKREAGVCGLPDPFGREFVYYASTKSFQNGATVFGDTPREAVDKLMATIEQGGK